MRVTIKFVYFFCFIFIINQSRAQIHPVNALGREMFDSFRLSNFDSFLKNSIFSLKESEFKWFLNNIRNKSIRNELIYLHNQDFPEDTNYNEKWQIAFEHQWRSQIRHLARHSSSQIKKESFIPILKEANEYGIQWKTTRLLGIEVLLPVDWKNGRFEIKGDLDLDESNSSERVLYIDRGLSYRFTLSKDTYGRTFMIGTDPENSDLNYDTGIIGNGSGQGDVILKFDEKTPSKLFYFCPDQKGAGGPILVKDLDDQDKPNQRLDLLLTFSYDQPERAFQIMIKQVVLSPKGPIFTQRPSFIGEVTLPRGLSF